MHRLSLMWLNLPCLGLRLNAETIQWFLTLDLLQGEA